MGNSSWGVRGSNSNAQQERANDPVMWVSNSAMQGVMEDIVLLEKDASLFEPIVNCKSNRKPFPADFYAQPTGRALHNAEAEKHLARQPPGRARRHDVPHCTAA